MELRVGRAPAMPADLSERQSVASAARAISRRAIVVALVLADALAIVAGLALAYLVRFRLNLGIFYEHSSSPWGTYASLGLALVPLFLLAYAAYQLYGERTLFDGFDEYVRVVSATTMAVMVVILLSFLIDAGLVIARGWIVVSWLGIVATMLVTRFVVRRVVYALRRGGLLATRILMIGSGLDVFEQAQRISEARNSGLRVVGVVDSDDLGFDGGDGRRRTLAALVQSTRADAIIAHAASVPQPVLSRIVREVSQLPTPLHIIPGMYEILTTGVHARDIAGMPLVTMNKARITGIDRVLKRLLDITVAGLTLLLAGPLLLVIALSVRLTSPGPALHRRRVMGQQGSEFDALKFRTMRVDGDAILAAHPGLERELRERGKLPRDPRVTTVGGLLRRWSIDELPQLINVLRGQMSMVGPRMITEDELHRFGHWRENLGTVKPGLTGLWQVSGRSDLGYEDRVRLDMHYIRNYSIWADLEILLRTAPAVLRGSGAY